MTSAVLEVTGMQCASRGALIEEALADQPGLEAVRVEPEAAPAPVTVTVTSDESGADVDAVRSAVTALGCGASVAEVPSGP
jgi:copper chaperone CopZ